MTDYLDFSLAITKPRKEFVGLIRFSMPADLFEFLLDLREAVGLAKVRLTTRYGRIRRHAFFLLQAGHRVVSRLRVNLSGVDVKIERWRLSRDSPLYEIYLEWRYIQHGRVLDYWSHLEKPNRLGGSWERVLFRREPLGTAKVQEVMKDAGFKMPSAPYSIQDRMKLMAKRVAV